MTGRLSALVLALSVVLSACGTRLSEAEQAVLLAGDALARPGVEATGGAADSTADVAAAVDQPTTAPTTAPTSTGGNSTSPTATDATRAPTPEASEAPPPAAVTTSGVDYTKPATGEPVQVGYMYISDLDGFAEAFGGTNPLGNQQAMFNVVADYMNAHGGLGGRPVELVPYGAEIAGSKSYSQSEQEACTHWTQDNNVVAVVVAEIGTSANLVKCLNDAEVMFVSIQGCCKTSSVFHRYQYHTSPAELGAEVVARHLVRLAVTKGLVTPDKQPVKDAIGALGYDHPENHAAMIAFQDEAKRFGLTPVPYEVHSPQSTADISTAVAQLPSAVLAHKSANANAVVSLCTGCMNLYMGQAESQNYYPKYVLSSYDNPFGLANGRDPKFLDGAVVVGWNPNNDADLYSNPEIWTNPTYELCREIQAPNGINDIANLKVTQSICGAVLLVHESAKAYGGTDMTGATLVAGKNRIGTSWPSTTAFANRFDARYAGSASHYRTMSYDRAIENFRYDSTTLYPFE